MKLFAPKYYKDFICIANKCKHSCCVGWEIDIDDNTLLKYEKLNSTYANNISDSIEYTPSAHFKLSSNERCPHLNQEGLCEIILNCGDKYLCDICREHPRFYNFTNNGKEVGIGLSCEEACRIILNSDNYDEMVLLEERSKNPDIVDFDAIAERERIYCILKDRELQIDEKIGVMYEYYDLFIDKTKVIDALQNIEYLNIHHKDLFLQFNHLHFGEINHKYIERLIAYFVYRHCSEAETFDDFVASLSFSLACVYLITSISKNDNIENYARIVSEEIEYSQNNVELLKDLFY